MPESFKTELGFNFAGFFFFLIFLLQIIFEQKAKNIQLEALQKEIIFFIHC